MDFNRIASTNVIGGILGLVAAGLFTVMLFAGFVGEWAYFALILVALLAALAIAGFPRLQELNLRSLKIILREIKDVQQQVEKTKAEIAEMYGGIEDLQREPLVLDKKKLAELGIGTCLTTGSANVRYVAGCIKRERERLARIFVNQKAPQDVATAILDASLDDNVFKWNGPEAALDVPPKCVEQRQAEKKSSAETSPRD